jgi:mRNA-degrading endonuclease RelE of RelBE toxin-antitoxin system
VSDASKERWDVAIDPPAVRGLARVQPRVVIALIEFIYGGLADDPHRRGKPLRGDLDGLWSARRGDYRVLYRLDEDTHTVYVRRIAGRADAYRPERS